MCDRLVPRKDWIDLVVLLAYAGVAAGMTWPLVSHIASGLPGGTMDTLVHYWNGWWVRQALAGGQSPFHTEYLFYPAGVSLVYHNFAWLSIVGWLLLRPLVGGFVAYNLTFLTNLALCGFGAYLLARDLTGDRRAAFLAGLIYQCWPFRLSQLDHPNLISTQWIPLFLLFLARSLRSGRWREGVLAGLFLTLTGYARWQLLVPAAIAGGIYLACTLPRRWGARHRWALALLLAVVVVAVALTPPVCLLVRQYRSTPADLLVEEEEATMQADLLAYLTPAASHPLLGRFTRLAYSRYYADRSGERRFPAYVGVTTLVLALLGVWRARCKSVVWVAVALVLLLLALGPTLRVNGRLYPGVPMPYRLAARLFFVRLLRFPDRFNLFLALPIAMLAGYGVADLLSVAGRRGRWLAVAVPFLLGGLILFESLALPVPLQRPPSSPFYGQLADESGDFAVLNLPIDSQKSKLYMFAQVTHRRPILQGKTPRLPEGAYVYLDGHPWLRSLRRVNEMDPWLADVSRQLGSLAEDGVRYLILHKDLVGADRLMHWQRYLPTAPCYEDDLIAVYATFPQAGRDFALTAELAPGVGPVRVLTSTACLAPGGMLEVDVGWGSTALPGQDHGVRLALVGEGGMVQEELLGLSPGWPTGGWPPNALSWGYYVLRVDPLLADGVYTVTLGLVDPATGALQGEEVGVGEVEVRRSDCASSLPPGAVGVNARFGEEMRLLGYELRREGGRVVFVPYWRLEQRMGTDYVVFVHVFDPASGVPVAQDDAMPHRWAYPTSYWGPGEIVEDMVPISLKGVAPGVYGVAVGVYDPATMERLAVVDGVGKLWPDGRLVLAETVEVAGGGP